jgi:hypothetical protein
MANHSYVDGPKLKKKIALLTLEHAVKSMWGDRFEVVELSDTPRYVHWVVSLPGSQIDDPQEAGRRMMAPGALYGFLVQYHVTGMWEFRHSLNNWEYWAQAKIMHMIAKALDVRTYRDDATDDPCLVDPYMLKATYRAHLCRNYEGREISADVREFHDRLLATAPEGFRD